MTGFPADSRRALELEMATELLRRAGQLRVRLAGSSMVPSMFSGDVLTIERTDPPEFKVDDVVVFSRGGQPITHRVIRTRRDSNGIGWITRGDACSVEDLPIAETEVLGRVVVVERDGREWSPTPLSIFGRAVRWVIRHSSPLLTLVLRFHALRSGFGRRQSTA